MRPLKVRENRLLQPLDGILGTHANVRILRVLTLRGAALSAGELGRSAKLGRTSIYPVLRPLESAGVIELVGAGSRKLVQLRERHPLSGVLRELFRAEAHRIGALTSALRGLLAELPHRPISAWVQQDAAEHAEGGDTLALFVVARPEDLEKIKDALNARLVDLEREYDIHVSVQGLTRSELGVLHRKPAAALDAVVLLAGVPPSALSEPSRRSAGSRLASHDEHDARSRRLALAVAAKIRRDPGLIAVAEDRVKRRVRTAGPGERRELMEWMRILSTMPPARLQRFLVADSERAVRLRQTLPALNLLSSAERDAVVRSRTDAEVFAAVASR